MSKYRAVAGAVMIHLCLGNLSTSGNIIPYLSSYMKSSGQFPYTSNADVQWVGAAGQVGFGFFGIVGGFLDEAIGTKLTCIIGCLVLSNSLLLSYSTLQTSLPLLVYTAGLGVGLGTAINYCVPMYAVVKWFPSKPGLISGMVLCGYFTGFTLSMVGQTLYLNPDNKESNEDGYFTDKTLLERVPPLFVYMGVITFVLQAVGAMLINKPSEIQPHSLITSSPYRAIGERSPLLRSDQMSVTTFNVLHRDVGPKELMYKPVFRSLWLTYLLVSVVGVTVTTTYKSFGQTFIHNDDFLMIVGCVGAGVNALASLFWGYLLDKTSYKTCMIAITVSMTLVTGTLPVVPHLGEPAFVVWILALYFFVAGNYTVMPAIIIKTYGALHASKNVGVLYTSLGVAAVLVAVGLQSFLDVLHYAGCYAAEPFCTALAFFVTLRLPDDLQSS